ncbi:MAG: DUF917 domain-containing protein [Gammaproteobacteria bacterium]|nr:DUF917 domain-containing protein [Gammaproteobacteria bacterium]MDH5344790.1 DUF917 domain-containing protein [Gammaproteobacteria bacterium]
MSVTITADDVADLCTGSVFLATGGGGDPYISQLLVEQALGKYGPVTLTELSEVPDDALVVTIGEVGAPSVSLEQLPIGTECLQVIDRFEAWVGRKITHVVSFEVGGANSVIPLIAAAARGIPLIDGDGMARALPEAQMMTFAIEGIRPSPALAVDYTGGAVYFDVRDAVLYERQVRNLAMAMGGMVFTAEHPMTAEEARRAIIPGTISFALELGRTLRAHFGSAKLVEAPLRALFGKSDYGVLKRLYTGKIVDINRRTVGGFDVGEAVLESTVGNEPPMRLAIRNEFLVAETGGRVVASVPDLITMVDHETSSPINSERVHYGQRVTVFGIGCPPHYRTARALEVVAPRAFGFDFDFVPIEDL